MMPMTILETYGDSLAALTAGIAASITVVWLRVSLEPFRRPLGVLWATKIPRRFHSTASRPIDTHTALPYTERVKVARTSRYARRVAKLLPPDEQLAIELHSGVEFEQSTTSHPRQARFICWISTRRIRRRILRRTTKKSSSVPSNN